MQLDTSTSQPNPLYHMGWHKFPNNKIVCRKRRVNSQKHCDCNNSLQSYPTSLSRTYTRININTKKANTFSPQKNNKYVVRQLHSHVMSVTEIKEAFSEEALNVECDYSIILKGSTRRSNGCEDAALINQEHKRFFSVV